MNIFTRMFSARDKPEDMRRAKDALGGSRFSFFFGSSTSGKPVNERTAMQMTAVYSCVRILSEAVAGLPLHVYRYGENGNKEKALTHPLYHLLHDEPNPEMTSFNFRETLMGHLLLYGNAYAQIIRNGKGEVIGLYPLMPSKMTVDRDSKGQLYYLYARGSDDSPVDSENGQVYLPPEQVLHIPGLGYDGIVGYSPLAMAKNAVGLAIATEEYGAKFFANDAAPGGVLEHPGVLKNPDKVRESWNKLFRGSANSHQIAVLEEGLKYQPMETKRGNIVLMPVISRRGSGKEAAMTKEQFEREKKYQAALAVARSMLRQGVINDADLVRIEARLKEKFKPVLGGFLF